MIVHQANHVRKRNGFLYHIFRPSHSTPLYQQEAEEVVVELAVAEQKVVGVPVIQMAAL
jgi:hypothetical protein